MFLESLDLSKSLPKMGAVDYLPDGSQVKCWKCENKLIDIGKKVGKLLGEKNYMVILREGGYIRVRRGKIVEILEDRIKHHYVTSEIPMFDKYGSRVYDTDGLKGILGEDYYF